MIRKILKLIFMGIYYLFSFRVLEVNGPWFFIFLALIPSALYSLWNLLLALYKKEDRKSYIYNLVLIFLALFISLGFMLDWQFLDNKRGLAGEDFQAVTVLRAIA